MPTTLAIAAAAVGARVIQLVRENRLAHYMALRSAALGGNQLHCRVGTECTRLAERMHIPVINSSRGQQPLSRIPQPRCASVCDAMPLMVTSNRETLQYFSFPWRAALSASPLHCATLNDYIDIAIREDALTTSMLQNKGNSVLVVSYESLLPKLQTKGNEHAICSMLDFIGLACRDGRGALLVRARTQSLHVEQPAKVVSNYAGVSTHLFGRRMGWMLDF
mmetsp:Transcript_41291/g.101898  ORF Transcript_41291/g.101898 Transcript_41291/m.101898 type:complete len:221 (+) Transcript_41291:524-1186(+)